MTHRIGQSQAIFWSHVDMRGPEECWNWMSGTTHKGNKGYGRFMIYCKRDLAHRIAYKLSGGILTKDKPFVLHTCDNGLCCNPNHLFCGTQRDNIQDMMRKKRNHPLKGCDNHFAILSEGSVLLIRALCNTGIVTYRTIAKNFNISVSHAAAINQRRIWKHI